ncbi:MAG: hypothetical protein C0404_01490 [Verrucomicrobia bacterium]|nr:hypothetical protein [Verrucomicrobiota bacterium]
MSRSGTIKSIMKRSSAVFKIGTRASRLARVQTAGVLEKLKEVVPQMAFEEIPMTTPGDRDRATDLKLSPADFFTRDLDEAVSSGKLDGAIHSAKDMPDPVPGTLDWCWLPWKEDPRDAIVLPKGRSVAGIPPNPRVGVSSERREAWCLRRFPGAKLCSIRGTIEERMAQLDNGDYDVLIMAAAALARLNLQDRISEWISLEDLPPPDGQGVLAMTFKAGDGIFMRLRSLFVKSVAFVSAGAGSSDMCTLAGIKAVRGCDVCLYDSLMDPTLLDNLKATALRVDTGKRCGNHSMPQESISDLITKYARRGLSVVRLKGGDAGIFGRLAEEVEALDALHLPYRVIPGVSSLNAATTGTGILLTRRGISRGFCVMTPRKQKGDTGSVGREERAELPIVFFMAVGVADEVARQLMAEGMPAATPAAMVFNAGSDSETVVRGRLDDIVRKAGVESVQGAVQSVENPGIFIVGEVTRFEFGRGWGALGGRRVLLTCSEDLKEKAASVVLNFGGVPVMRPLIKLVPESSAVEQISNIKRFNWLVLTSPASVRCFAGLMDHSGASLRTLPGIIVCGPGTAAELGKYRIIPDAAPDSDFGVNGLRDIAGSFVKPGQKVLRLRSDKAGPEVADFLRTLGAEVNDCLLYRNEPVRYDSLPAFDAVFFASASAVEVFISQWGRDALRGRTIAVIGRPTERGLEEHGLCSDAVGREATVESCITALAERYVRQALEMM